jgi:glyoxylase-like metal-dependent hydrolase (beta-lactamase superfamily II)
MYQIKPLLLATVQAEKGPMTYMVYHSQPVIRPYVMWYIRAGGKNVLVDSAIEAEDYRLFHPAFEHMPFKEVQSFTQALASVGCTPDDIDIIIQTHLHLDHMYNSDKCHRAKIYVQEEELKFALNPHPIFDVFFASEKIKKLNFEVIRGNKVILPGIKVMLAPGHTPGCQSVIVDTAQGKAVITGCCTIMENFTMQKDAKIRISPFATHPVIAPGIHTNLFDAYESSLKIKKLADIIIPMHDPEFAARETLP